MGVQKEEIEKGLNDLKKPLEEVRKSINVLKSNLPENNVWPETVSDEIIKNPNDFFIPQFQAKEQDLVAIQKTLDSLKEQAEKLEAVAKTLISKKDESGKDITFDLNKMTEAEMEQAVQNVEVTAIEGSGLQVVGSKSNKSLEILDNDLGATVFFKEK